MLATADALPEVVDAVAGRASVLVDGGIRRGIDIAIALALGADAVLVGRPPLWGLAAAARRARAASSRCCAASWSWPWASAAAPRRRELTRAHVQRAPARPYIRAE